MVVIDVKLSKIAKFCLEGHAKKFYNYIHQSFQSEKEAWFLVLRIQGCYSSLSRSMTQVRSGQYL